MCSFHTCKEPGMQCMKLSVNIMAAQMLGAEAGDEALMSVMGMSQL